MTASQKRVKSISVQFAITIGCYKLTDFIELNVRRCRTLFGEDVPILLSDDLSPISKEIEALADRHGCDYWQEGRRSHFSGDMQACVNSLVFAKETNADVSIKISQRLIPVLPRFREMIEESFRDPEVCIVLPGRPHINQIARPASRFYSKFGILTDVIAVRNGALIPHDLAEIYRGRFRLGVKHADCLVETTWGWVLANRFKGGQVRVLDGLANHVPFQPKVFLRKSQAMEKEYRDVAAMEGVKGMFDIREWGRIEGKEYKCRPSVV